MLSELRGRQYLQFRANFKETTEAGAETVGPDQLLERVARTPNLARALLKVSSNKGGPGIDGQSVDEVVEAAHELIPRLRDILLAGTYQPGDIRRVWIPKPGGGQRGLGIPNVIDRVVQQAVLQILEPVFEPKFHDSSHGFRPGRGTRTAMDEATKYLKEGFTITVDIDLSKFFDRVHHQRLLNRLAQSVSDGRVLQLIHRMLKCNVVLPEGICVATSEGTPQGGPLSPLLSNVVLDELDWELGRRGLRFVRYADDFSIFVRSRRAGERVMASVRKFIEQRLRLVVNEDKSSVSEPYGLKFLGFQFGRDADGQVSIDLSSQTIQRINSKVRALTPRNWGQSFSDCLDGLNSYLRGWVGYFRISTAVSARRYQRIDAHIRRRLRVILAGRFRRPRHLYRHLLRLGVSPREAKHTCFKCRSPWPRSISFGMQNAYRNAWFSDRLVSLHQSWTAFHAPPTAPEQLLLFALE